MELFYFKLLASFIIGAAWVTLVTVLSERAGSKIGGFIGGTPSTSVVTLFFIALIQTPESAREATLVIPVVMGLQGFYAITFLIFSRRYFWLGLFTALLAWILPALVVVRSAISLWPSLGFFVVMLVATYFCLEKYFKDLAFPRAFIHYTFLQIAGRALFGGFMITFAVLMSYLAGPVWGGVFASFPAVFTSTLIILNHSSGLAGARGVVKPLMLSGMITITVYAMAVHFLYLPYGVWMGTFLAYIVGLAGTGLAYFVFRNRLT